MKAITAIPAVFGILATLGAQPAAGQAQWDERLVQGGVEFRLTNAEGNALFLRCSESRVDAGFVLAEPIEAASGALLVGHLSDSEPGWIFRPRVSHRFPVAQVRRAIPSDRSLVVGSISRWRCSSPRRESTCGRPVSARPSKFRPSTRFSRDAREQKSVPSRATRTESSIRTIQHRLHWLRLPLPTRHRSESGGSATAQSATHLRSRSNQPGAPSTIPRCTGRRCQP